MDEADLAQERERAILAAALSPRQPSLKSPNGMCIWCKVEPVVLEQPSVLQIVDKTTQSITER